MKYRFHYQGTSAQEISPEPEVLPERWHGDGRAFFIAVAYVEASDLAQAYVRLSQAVASWNEQVRAGTIIDAFDDACFTYEGVDFFHGSPLCKRLSYDPDHSEVRNPAKRLPLRQPLPGDVFEPVRSYGYMLGAAPTLTGEHLGAPFQWFWLPPLRVVVCTQEQSGDRD